MIVELKYDKSAESAIEQIKKKQYVDCLKDYSCKIFLVRINYNNGVAHTDKLLTAVCNYIM